MAKVDRHVFSTAIHILVTTAYTLHVDLNVVRHRQLQHFSPMLRDHRNFSTGILQCVHRFAVDPNLEIGAARASKVLDMVHSVLHLLMFVLNSSTSHMESTILASLRYSFKQYRS